MDLGSLVQRMLSIGDFNLSAWHNSGESIFETGGRFHGEG